MLLISVKKLTLQTRLVDRKRNQSAQLISLRNSIAKDGLLNPLVVVKRRNKYVILDGKKRFKAIKDLHRQDNSSLYLKKIPCILEEDIATTLDVKRPALMNDPELAHVILTQVKLGAPYPYIAQRFDCDMSVIEDAASLTKLHLKVLQCFNNQTISLAQAAAFATIPNPKAQWDLLLKLGPFVSDQKIIAAIKEGETVISLPDDNVLIIPSRERAIPNIFDKAPQERAELTPHLMAA